MENVYDYYEENVSKLVKKYNGFDFILISDLLELEIDDNDFEELLEFLFCNGIEVVKDEKDLDNIEFNSFNSKRDGIASNRLSRDEVKKLFIKYSQTKDDNIRNILFYNNIHLVKSFILRNNGTLIESDEDLEQTAYMVLLEAIDSFDPFGTLEFTLYLYKLLNSKIVLDSDGDNKLLNLFLSEKSNIEKRDGMSYGCMDVFEEIYDLFISEGIIRNYKDPRNNYLQKEEFKRKVSLYESLSLDEVDVYSNQDLFEKVASKEYLGHIMDTISERLNPKEARILFSRVGLLDGNTHTLREIGNELHLSSESIRAKTVRAIYRIRSGIGYYSENNKLFEGYYGVVDLYDGEDSIDKEHSLVQIKKN